MGCLLHEHSWLYYWPLMIKATTVVFLSPEFEGGTECLKPRYSCYVLLVTFIFFPTQQRSQWQPIHSIQKDKPIPSGLQGSQDASVRNWEQRPNIITKFIHSIISTQEIIWLFRTLSVELGKEMIYILLIMLKACTPHILQMKHWSTERGWSFCSWAMQTKSV